MIGLLMLAAASAQMTLTDLQAICAGSTPSASCRLYILGVSEGVALGASLANDHSHSCLPDDVSATELVAVIQRTMKADLAKYPQDRNLAAAGFIGAALTKQYPCSR